MASSHPLANTPRAGPRCAIDDLAGHVSLEDIFRHLPPYDRLLTSEVCKRWLSISRKAWLDVIHLDLSTIPGPNIAAIIKQCPNLRTVFAQGKAFGVNELRILSRIPLDSITLCNCSSLILACGSFAEDTLAGVFSSDLQNAAWRELNLRDFEIILRGPLGESLPVCSPASLPGVLSCLEFRDLAYTCEDEPYLPASAFSFASLGQLQQLEGLILNNAASETRMKSPVGLALVTRGLFREIGTLRNLRELYLGTRHSFVALLQPLFELPKLEVLFLHEIEFGRQAYAPPLGNVAWLRKLTSEHATLRILVLKGYTFQEQEVELTPRLRYPNGLGSSPAPLLHIFLDKELSEKIRFPTPFDSALIYTFNEPFAQFLEREEIKPIFKGVWIAEKIKEAAKVDVMRTS